jgi:hypothetical protein
MWRSSIKLVSCAPGRRGPAPAIIYRTVAAE